MRIDEVPTKRDYCRRKADENTYTRNEEFLNLVSLEPYFQEVRYVAYPSMFYEEYDRLFNAKLIKRSITLNIKKYYALVSEIKELTDGYKQKDGLMEDYKSRKFETIEQLRDYRDYIEKIVEKARRIRDLAS